MAFYNIGKMLRIYKNVLQYSYNYNIKVYSCNYIVTSDYCIFCENKNFKSLHKSKQETVEFVVLSEAKIQKGSLHYIKSVEVTLAFVTILLQKSFYSHFWHCYEMASSRTDNVALM